MKLLRKWASRLGGAFNKTQHDRDLAEEIESHLQLHIDDNLRTGMSPAEARRQALLKFGGIESTKESYRDRAGLPFIETLFHDVRFALRMLRKNPGFTAIAVLTLSLGIGASTAVFSLVDAVLLKPLPYPHYERIVFPWRQSPQGLNLGYNEIPWGRPEFRVIAQESKTFQSLGAFQGDSFNLTGSGDPIRLDGLRASAGFFPALGVSPLLGRTFSFDEDQPGHQHSVVLGYQLWRDRFGADSAILGRSIELNGEGYIVIGVMPRGFAFPRAEEMPGGFTFAPEAQLWIPLALSHAPRMPAEDDLLAVVGRLKPGIGVDQGQAEMNLFTQRFETQNPGGKGWFNTRVTPISRQIAGDTRRPLLLILCAVVVVLLIACSNVASLLLTRSLGRKREFILRTALGANNRRLIRQLLTESLLLATFSGFLGVLLANAAIHFVKILGPSNIPRLGETNLDLRVLAFALAVSFCAGILFGLAPAIAVSRKNLIESLKAGGQRSGESHPNARLRNALLVSEVALAFALVIAAGLLTQSFFHLLHVDPGFTAERVLTFELSLPATRYSDQPRTTALYQNVLQKLRALPAVESAGIIETLPMGGATESTGIRIPGHIPADKNETPYSNYTVASPGYFVTVGTRLLRGRDFLASDTADSLPVTIINNAMAKKFWPGSDPLGKQVGPGSTLYPAATIIGIVADTKRLSLREEPAPEMFVLYNQKVWPSLLTMDVVLRTKIDPASASASARQAIHSVDPDLPLAKISTLETLLDESVTQQRFAMLVLGVFGALALLLASIGMYGVISYSTMQRTPEIGIRMALGAQPRNVLAMVLTHGARLAALGIAIGVAAALAMSHLLSSFLFGVPPADPATFAAVALVLSAVALFACYIPARRAMRVDPAVALRHE
jgi:putative ABC transport system permease protein